MPTVMLLSHLIKNILLKQCFLSKLIVLALQSALVFKKLTFTYSKCVSSWSNSLYTEYSIKMCHILTNAICDTAKHIFKLMTVLNDKKERTLKKYNCVATY